jgi:uncharacterized repeat protein (TIGR03809 family)
LRSGFFMSVRLPAHALDEVAQKWRALAERRLAHFVELCESGRWRRYYSEEQFLYRMREAIRLSERWAQIALGRPGEVGTGEAQPLPDRSDRTAA